MPTDQSAGAPLCSHDPAWKCGCWLDAEGRVRRHGFRFVPGDRVHWGGVVHRQFHGVTGTVVAREGGHVDRMRPMVVWDAGVSEWAPTIFPDSLQLTHIEDEP